MSILLAEESLQPPTRRLSDKDEQLVARMYFPTPSARERCLAAMRASPSVQGVALSLMRTAETRDAERIQTPLAVGVVGAGEGFASWVILVLNPELEDDYAGGIRDEVAKLLQPARLRNLVWVQQPEWESLPRTMPYGCGKKACAALRALADYYLVASARDPLGALFDARVVA